MEEYLVRRIDQGDTKRMGETIRRTSSAGTQLSCFEDFPHELLDVAACDLWRHLPEPSLFSLPGRDKRPLFVTVLLLRLRLHTGQVLLKRHLGPKVIRKVQVSRLIITLIWNTAGAAGLI